MASLTMSPTGALKSEPLFNQIAEAIEDDGANLVKKVGC